MPLPAVEGAAAKVGNLLGLGSGGSSASAAGGGCGVMPKSTENTGGVSTGSKSTGAKKEKKSGVKGVLDNVKGLFNQ